jgi:lactate racemase
MNANITGHDAAQISLPHGRHSVTLRLPPGTGLLEPAQAPPAPIPQSALKSFLDDPIGSQPLGELLRSRQPKTVAITISDITRTVPNKVFLPVLLEEVEAAGIPPERISIVIGTGMHRPSTEAEREYLLGKEILGRYQVEDHRSDAPETLVQVSDEPYVAVNKRFAEADFKIVTGFIEPHFMAGYSGGRKGVCPALVDLATVQRFHGYDTMANPKSREGLLEGNPCHAISLEVARRVGVDFLFNVGVDGNKQIVGVYCGELEAAHAAGCAEVSRWTRAHLDAPYDLVITHGGGYPLDQTFYQTVKAMCTALPALHEESTLIVVSSCAEQLGSPDYTDLMKEYAGRWKEFLTDIAAHPETTAKDQWELQLQCRVLERIGTERLLFISDDMDPELQRQANVTPVLGEGSAEERLQQTVDMLVAEQPDARVAVIPGGPYTTLVKAVQG